MLPRFYWVLRADPLPLKRALLHDLLGVLRTENIHFQLERVISQYKIDLFACLDMPGEAALLRKCYDWVAVDNKFWDISATCGRIPFVTAPRAPARRPTMTFEPKSRTNFPVAVL